MKKVTVSISYDDEKLSALRLYLGQKNSTVEKELELAIDNLYGKTVPSNVREFIDMRTGITPKPPEKKKKPTSVDSKIVSERSEGI